MIRIIMYCDSDLKVKGLRSELRKLGITEEIDVVGVNSYSAANVMVNSPNKIMLEVLFSKDEVSETSFWKKFSPFRSEKEVSRLEKIIELFRGFKDEPSIALREVEFIY